MAYSNFSLGDVIKRFGLILKDKNDLFANIPEVGYSEYLDFTLKYNLRIASKINTEKARSEMIITPILLELRRITHSDQRNRVFIESFGGHQILSSKTRFLNSHASKTMAVCVMIY